MFTGASRAAARQLLAAVDLLRFFPVVVGGDDVSRTKPAPDGILRACVLGVAATVVAYVGDSPLDLEAARRSGAVAVAAAWGHLFDAEAPCDMAARAPQDILFDRRAARLGVFSLSRPRRLSFGHPAHEGLLADAP